MWPPPPSPPSSPNSQLVGGEAQYAIAPRLIEYTVALTRALPPLINKHFGELISSTVQVVVWVEAHPRP